MREENLPWPVRATALRSSHLGSHNLGPLTSHLGSHNLGSSHLGSSRSDGGIARNPEHLLLRVHVAKITVMSLLHQVACGLVYLHGLGVIHGGEAAAGDGGSSAHTPKAGGAHA